MIIHELFSGDISKLIICILFYIYFIFLMILHKKIKNDNKKTKIWRILCTIPLVISIIHIIIYTYGEAFKYIFFEYIFIYIQGILITLLPIILMKDKKIIKIINNIIITIISFIAVINYISPNVVVNYANKNLKDSYISLCNYFEKKYIMKEWKRIEYNKIKEDGLKLIEEAEQTDDINKYYEALDKFIQMFHDGHMGLNWYKDDVKKYIEEKLKSYNDYGLLLITLDDKSTIAVFTEDNLEIKEGDIITKWDDIPIEEALKNAKNPIPESVIDNDNIMKPFWLSGTGGETVNVTYINSNNEEKTTTLKKIGNELPRAIRARRMFFHNDDKKYTHKMINNEIGYIKITQEKTTEINDYIGYATGNHKYAREMYRKDLRDLREQGMTKLIIDIRNNGGGYDDITTAFASLFTKETIYAFSLGIKENNHYKKTTDRYIIGDGEFSDIKIVVLTNMNCGSAGDGMVATLSKLKNTTIAGLSEPAGINQETGGEIYMPKGAIINFPIGPILDKDANPYIDIDYTRKSRTPLDIKIPLTKESALKIFDNEDHELEWAMNYLER